MVAKAIGHYILYLPARLVVAIKPDLSEHREGAQIVDASHVVVVDMGHEDCVKRLERQRHELLAYVGSAIYEHTCSGRLNKGYATQTTVAWVGAATNVTLTSQRRDSARCSCTKESNLE